MRDVFSTNSTISSSELIGTNSHYLSGLIWAASSGQYPLRGDQNTTTSISFDCDHDHHHDHHHRHDHDHDHDHDHHHDYDHDHDRVQHENKNKNEKQKQNKTNAYFSLLALKEHRWMCHHQSPLGGLALRSSTAPHRTAPHRTTPHVCSTHQSKDIPADRSCRH
mmetsp:Transcript_2805/g.7534  ORF Transcript_2805/g.7534 Transcript_2805/m.7534 type:complete len:164 (-) Transcript_2805:4370-4861(-)